MKKNHKVTQSPDYFIEKVGYMQTVVYSINKIKRALFTETNLMNGLFYIQLLKRVVY